MQNAVKCNAELELEVGMTQSNWKQGQRCKVGGVFGRRMLVVLGSGLGDDFGFVGGFRVGGFVGGVGWDGVGRRR